MDGDFPAAVGVTRQTSDFVAVVQLDAVVIHFVDQLAGECAEVDVSAGLESGGGYALSGCSTFGQQGSPLSDLVGVFGVLHLGEQRVRDHGLVPGL